MKVLILLLVSVGLASAEPYQVARGQVTTGPGHPCGPAVVAYLDRVVHSWKFDYSVGGGISIGALPPATRVWGSWATWDLSPHVTLVLVMGRVPGRSEVHLATLELAVIYREDPGNRGKACYERWSGTAREVP